jgi:hypothetical protein
LLIIANADDGFHQTMVALNLLLGLESTTEQPSVWYNQFGYHGYSINIYAWHIDYLNALNLVLQPELPVFDADAINRWKLINELLLTGFVTATTAPVSGSDNLSRQFPALAALAAFPTLEEVARRISNRWDEEGLVLTDILESEGIIEWKPDGEPAKPKSYKKDHRIVVLSHKLQLMDLSLAPELRRTIASLDAVLRRPMIDGINSPMSPLYSRLQFFRDQWVHGRRFEGWEALLISFYLALIYFGSQKPK